MIVYLDSCCLQRPLDDKSQIRIRLEAEAILSVIDLVEAGVLDIISSDVLVFETERIPHVSRQDFVWEMIAGARGHVEYSDQVEERARELIQAGIRTLDSVHLASAEAGGADYFCTCDDAFLKKAKRAVRGGTKVVSPLELVEEIER